MSYAVTTAAPHHANHEHTAAGGTTCRAAQPDETCADVERLLAVARGAGMLVMLDAQIGRERYQSVAGSVVSLQRFATALCRMMLTEQRAAG
ncbi:hypothetical protein [Paraburkholderia sp. ZP32-5]|uniref:hypothetical protein n=1 Tax=Paraburkholderia sp. ZP32-5 TaxID=2883245 RepID=UPI003FA3B635